MDTARTTTTTQTQTNSDATSGTSQPSAMRTSPLYAASPAVRLDSGSGTGTSSSQPPQVSELVTSPGPGESLQPSVQRSLEGSYRADMGAVRVHTDARSSAVTDSISARAFTYGPNIFLGTGERASDIGLMAHEGAHVVQQQGSPVMQMSADTPTAASDAYEQEARSASLAVQQDQAFAVMGRTSDMRVQKEDVPWWKRGLKAVASVASAGKDLLLKKAADWAKKIPGYDLLTVVLGKDPITDKPVERNATNLLRGIAGLIPGGTEMFDNLQKSGALQKAFDWFNQEVAKLNLSWVMIKGLFRKFWDALSASDILNPSSVFEKLGVIFDPPLKRLINFALSSGKKILELIFEGALSLAGEFGQQILAIFRKAANVFSRIVNDPLGFLRNLIQAIKGGFQNFSKNILKHLKNALFEWLFGALAGAGLTLPDKFDLRGILSIVLQVLGLTYVRMREKLVKLIGEPAVAFIEKAFEFLKIIVTQGIAAAWQKLLEFATGLVDTVIESIRNWVIKSVVEAAVTKLVTMFNPVGAIIQGIITIYNTVKFFIERAKQIAALAAAIFDSIANIATGNIGAAIDYVEKTMARGLVVIIGFLAGLVGLGGVSNEIKKIIQKIQSIVDNAINKVVNFIVEKAKGLIGKVTGKDGKPKGEDTSTVITNVRQDILPLSKRRYKNTEEFNEALAGIYRKFKPQGLKSLAVSGIRDDPALPFQILAEASPAVPVIVISWQDLYEPGQEPQGEAEKFASGKGFVTYARLIVNGRPATESAIQNEDGKHAEENVLDSSAWKAELDRARELAQLAQPKETIIRLVINRSPCHQICAGKLVDALKTDYWPTFKDANTRKYVNFYLVGTGAYEGRFGATTGPDLARLAAAGWHLQGLQVGSELTARGKVLTTGIQNLLRKLRLIKLPK